VHPFFLLATTTDGVRYLNLRGIVNLHVKGHQFLTCFAFFVQSQSQNVGCGLRVYREKKNCGYTSHSSGKRGERLHVTEWTGGGEIASLKRKQEKGRRRSKRKENCEFEMLAK
jgi:hypothetical protein